MRNKKLQIGIILAIILVITVGCKQSSRFDHFSKEEQTLSWSGERTRSFGDADYSTIKNEGEAIEILKNKYKVMLPTYYGKTKKILEKEIPSVTVKSGKTKYSIFARNKELEFRLLTPFYKGDELQVFSEMVLTYTYSVDQEQTYVKSQIVNIKITPIKGTLPNDNVKDLVKALGKNMNLSDQQLVSGLAGYEKRIKGTTTPIKDDYLVIASNANVLDKKQEFLKEISAVYDEEGTFRELYVELSDQLE
ncbi:hypothetical protein IGJ02_000150 [Enterococcus sp. DIV0724b]|uniref:hypothetical protein n=1 Tax=Enterococcus sp. DIV0724b TaxID=2774694 RepID=UPI003D2FE2B0